jgi:hypothetical protein
MPGRYEDEKEVPQKPAEKKEEPKKEEPKKEEAPYSPNPPPGAA